MLFYPIFSSTLHISIVTLGSSCGMWGCEGSSSVKEAPWESRQAPQRMWRKLLSLGVRKLGWLELGFHKARAGIRAHCHVPVTTCSQETCCVWGPLARDGLGRWCLWRGFKGDLFFSSNTCSQGFFWATRGKNREHSLDLFGGAWSCTQFFDAVQDWWQSWDLWELQVRKAGFPRELISRTLEILGDMQLIYLLEYGSAAFMHKYNNLSCFQHGAHCLCCYTLAGATGKPEGIHYCKVKQSKFGASRSGFLFQFCNLHAFHSYLYHQFCP